MKIVMQKKNGLYDNGKLIGKRRNNNDYASRYQRNETQKLAEGRKKTLKKIKAEIKN